MSTQENTNSIMPTFKRSFKKILFFFGNRSSTQLTFLGVLLGFGFGYITQLIKPPKEFIAIIGFPGKLFMNALKLLIIPLIALIMIRVPSDMGEISKAKKIGYKAMIYYLGTSFLASFEGLAFYNIIKPGSRLSNVCEFQPEEVSLASEYEFNIIDSILKIGLDAIPSNMFVAFVKNNIFGILFFFLAFGFALSVYKDTEEGINIKKYLDLFFQIMMDLLNIVILFTPVGVFSLISVEISKLQNLCIFLKLGIFIATFLTAIIFHVFIIYSLIYLTITKKNPFKLMRYFIKAALTAFATASSAAALPLSMEGAERAKLDTEVSNFVLPLGATVNMDGSCIYYPITVLFLCALNNRTIPISTQIVIAIISSIITIGGAPIPSGALVFLVLVLNAAGMPLFPQISYIWAIDWFMDRTLTANNVIGDSIGAGVINEIYLKNKKNYYCRDSKNDQKNILRTVSNSTLSMVNRLKDKSISFNLDKKRLEYENYRGRSC